MGLFSSENKESKGSPLFAGLLGTAAVGATPLGEYLADKHLAPETDRLSKEIASSTQEDALSIVEKLKDNLLDKRIRDIPIFVETNTGAGFTTAAKDYLPEKKEFFKAIDKGGYRVLDNTDRLDPLEAVKKTRKAGGFITAPAGTDIATIAHELGHASILNKNQGFRGTKLFDKMDMLGRYLQGSNRASRTAGLFALAGLATDSENDSKYLIPAVAAATQAPLIYEEAKASKEGLKALKNIIAKQPTTSELVEDTAKKLVSGEGGKITKEVYDLAKPMLRKALGTYGARSAGIIAAPLLAIAARSQFDKATRD